MGVIAGQISEWTEVITKSPPGFKRQKWWMDSKVPYDRELRKKDVVDASVSRACI